MTTESFPKSLQASHRIFLENLIRVFREDPRMVGVAAAGSYLTDTMDAFSDLDLVIAVEPGHHAEVMADRREIAASLGSLLAAFTGEHVGEPRLLICLYEQPLLHLDLKLISLEDSADRVEDPAVLWQRGERFSDAMEVGEAVYPEPDPQWIEDRFWIWVHYAATKIGRGELFEALDFLSFVRGTVLGPLGLIRAGSRPAGVRRIETVAPAFAEQLKATVAGHDSADCFRALRACADLYRSLRSDSEIETGDRAEKAAMDYLQRVESGRPESKIKIFQ